MLPSIILKTKKTNLKDLKDFLVSLGLKKLENNPDFKSIGENSDLKIKDIRDLKLFLQKKSFSHPPRVVLIKNAQLLNPQSQNALLKILEEPPQSTFIILQTPQPQSLLETIRSRCQTISLESKTAVKINNKDKPLSDLFGKSTLQRLSWAEEKAKTISDPKAYLDQQTHHLLKLLKNDPNPRNQLYLKTTTQALSFLNANLDFKTVLTWLTLNLA